MAAKKKPLSKKAGRVGAKKAVAATKKAGPAKAKSAAKRKAPAKKAASPKRRRGAARPPAPPAPAPVADPVLESIAAAGEPCPGQEAPAKPGALARLKAGVGNLFAKMTGRSDKSGAMSAVPESEPIELATGDILSSTAAPPPPPRRGGRDVDVD
jgi:hypothetical protein